MATVYLAHDVRHDRDVAIKVLHPGLGAALEPVSNDLKRATASWREYRGDAWMYRVVNP